MSNLDTLNMSSSCLFVSKVSEIFPTFIHSCFNSHVTINCPKCHPERLDLIHFYNEFKTLQSEFKILQTSVRNEKLTIILIFLSILLCDDLVGMVQDYEPTLVLNSLT